MQFCIFEFGCIFVYVTSLLDNCFPAISAAACVFFWYPLTKMQLGPGPGSVQQQSLLLCCGPNLMVWLSGFFVMCCFCFPFLPVQESFSPLLLHKSLVSLTCLIFSLCNLVDFQGCFSSVKLSPVLLFHPCVHYKLQVAFPCAHLSAPCGSLEMLNDRIAVIGSVCSAQSPEIEPG